LEVGSYGWVNLVWVDLCMVSHGVGPHFLRSTAFLEYHEHHVTLLGPHQQMRNHLLLRGSLNLEILKARFLRPICTIVHGLSDRLALVKGVPEQHSQGSFIG